MSREREMVRKAIDEEIYQPALARCVEFAKVESPNAIPNSMKKRLRGIVNATVHQAVRPGFYADMNDPMVREMVIQESLKQLVWALNQAEARQTDFVTPDFTEEDFEAAFKAEQRKKEDGEREAKLRMVEDRQERLYDQRQTYAKTNVSDETSEITPAELERSRNMPAQTAEEDEFENLGLDQAVKNALKQREERRKLILSRLEEPEVPEWLKHAVDAEDTEYFPMASGRFSAEKNREQQITEFFQKELDDLAMGSEEETKLLEFIDKFIEDEESGRVEEEPVEEIKRRVNEMLKEIEDRKAKS
jgi:hypothetical protein